VTKRRSQTRTRKRSAKPSRKRSARPSRKHSARPARKRSPKARPRAPKPAAVLGLTALAEDDLELSEKVPNKAEKTVVGAASTIIRRGTPEFDALVSNQNADVVFKDEENTGADRMTTSKLAARVDALASLVRSEWTGVRLRVTEAWDENLEHGPRSIHYEARAVDLTTSPIDGSKLGRLARLAVNAGFDWVFYENKQHVHASMSK